MQNNNNETKINFMNLLPSLKSGKVTLDFGSVEISIDINVNRKDNVVNQVANKIVEEAQDKIDNEPVVDKLMSEELDKDEIDRYVPIKFYKSKNDNIKPIDKSNFKELQHEDETGWFKGTFRYGGKTRNSLHYYEDGIAVCDTGVVSRNHILSESSTKVDNPNSNECCRKCQLVLAKRKTANYREIQKSNNVNATGWYLRMTDSRKGIYKHFYKDGHTICRNQWQLTSVDKATSLDSDNEYKLCKVCLEKAKTNNSKADISNKKVIRTLSSKDIIKPNEMLERWNSKLIKIDNPVPLNDTNGDDIYIEAAKRLLVVYRKHINNTMRKLSSDNRMTIDNTTVKFYCKNKIVEVNVVRNPNLKNSELSIRKINVMERTSPNQKITGNSYDMTSMVTKVILERSKMSNEEKD